MDEKIKELAEQVEKIRTMFAQMDSVISVTITNAFIRDAIDAEIHVVDRLDGMQYERDFVTGFVKESMKIGNVSVFCLKPKEDKSDD